MSSATNLICPRQEVEEVEEEEIGLVEGIISFFLRFLMNKYLILEKQISILGRRRRRYS